MSNIVLKDDECLDDLQLDNMMIIQKKGGYKFSTDSVLLANFAKIKQNDIYVDLCSGSGVVAILASYKNKVKKSYAVEIQKDMADRATRSILYNGLNIEVINEDLKIAPNILGFETVDVITVNPPYNASGLTSNLDEIKLATHEISINVFDLALTCKRLLKFGGKVYIVHRADRLVDIMNAFRENDLEPKVLRIVYPKLSKEPNLVLIEAKKGAKSSLKILSPLVLCNEDGTETDELKRIYCRK